jgi:hypothetical protein
MRKTIHPALAISLHILLFATAMTTVHAGAQGAVPAAAASLPTKTEAAAVTVLENTLLQLQTRESIQSKHIKSGTPLLFCVYRDVLVDDRIAIPRGATVHGVVVEVKKAGRVRGQPELSLDLVSLEMGGKTYPIEAYTFRMKGVSKTPQTKKDAAIGLEAGATAGAVSSSVHSVRTKTPPNSSDLAVRTLAGAAAGAGVGAFVAAATPGPEVRIPSEAQVDFRLATPLTVTLLSPAETEQLQRSLRPGGPVLYLRDDAR